MVTSTLSLLFPTLTYPLSLPKQSFLPLLLPIAYALLHTLYPTPRQRSWLLTALAATIMVIISAPLFAVFTKEIVWNREGVVSATRAVREWGVAEGGEEWWAVRIGARVFQTYLISDLFIGSFHYASHITVGSGWVHHIAYLAVVEYAIRMKWAHVFCFGAVMEFPTAILALSFLHPRFRNDVLFASTFFLIRVAFHLVLLYSYLPVWLAPSILHTIGLSTAESKADAYSDAYDYGLVPSIVLTMSWPVHVMWMIGCVKGILKRRKAAVEKTGKSEVGVVQLEIVVAGVDEKEKSSSEKVASTKVSFEELEPTPQDRPKAMSPSLRHSRTRGRESEPLKDITNPWSSLPLRTTTHSQSRVRPQVMSQSVFLPSRSSPQQQQQSPSPSPSLRNRLGKQYVASQSTSASSAFLTSSTLASTSMSVSSMPGSYVGTFLVSDLDASALYASVKSSGVAASEQDGWRRRLRTRINSSKAWIGNNIGYGGFGAGVGVGGESGVRSVECAAG